MIQITRKILKNTASKSRYGKNSCGTDAMIRDRKKI